jgi:hypothetical protein
MQFIFKEGEQSKEVWVGIINRALKEANLIRQIPCMSNTILFESNYIYGYAAQLLHASVIALDPFSMQLSFADFAHAHLTIYLNDIRYYNRLNQLTKYNNLMLN